LKKQLLKIVFRFLKTKLFWFCLIFNDKINIIVKQNNVRRSISFKLFMINKNKCRQVHGILKKLNRVVVAAEKITM